MDDKESRSDLIELAEAYLAEALDPFDRAEFESRLREDEEARDALLAAARRDLSLRRALNALEPARQDATPRRKFRPVKKAPSPYPWIMAAAALIAVVVGLLLFSGPSRPPAPPRAVSHVPAPPPPPSVEVPRPKPTPATEPGPPPPPAPPVQTRPQGTPPTPEDRATQRAVPPKRLARAEPQPASQPTVSNPAEPAAQLESLAGRVVLVGETGIRPARAGRPIPPGQGLRTGRTPSRSRIRLSDGTTLDLAADTEVRLQAALGRIRIVKGTLTAVVAPQKKGASLRFETDHGAAVVLGTRLRITVHATHTRLEVEEGSVRLERNGESRVVTAGRYGIAAAGNPLVVREDLPEVVTVNFGPPGAPLPQGVLNDSGDAFDLKRGYGWTAPRGTISQRGGRYHQDTGLDALRSTVMSVGSRTEIETWRMILPNGRYIVSLCVGDPKYEQGPHHVALESKQVINNRITLPGRYFVLRNIPVEIRDGDLTMRCGGPRGTKIARDKTTDTTLNFLVIRKVSRNGEK